MTELRQQVQRRLQEMEQLSARREQTVEARLTDLAGRLPELDRYRDDTVPVDAPAQFREVRDKLDTGQLDWLTVWRGGTEDEAARAVSVWMNRRLTAAQAEFRAAEQDVQR
ncbi:hypothetical protein AB0C29_00125 [Actinoplanes sp. NPDC048791]|uniref:hypothetical protein n=1 Tax=Actinoplanes sp. NPDC048791 TaxID=3154623 RepID=UPI0033DBD00A